MIVQSKLTEARALLSTLYLFFILNIVFRDIHQFLSPGYMDWVIAGEMFGMKITDGLMLFGAFAVELTVLVHVFCLRNQVIIVVIEVAGILISVSYPCSYHF